MPADTLTTTQPSAPTNAMPDIALQPPQDRAEPLQQVGMAGIALPLRLLDSTGQEVSCQARAQLCVNIARAGIKGIHMSRLYLLLEQFAASTLLTPNALLDFLATKLESHTGISDRASIRLEFDYLCQRPALRSEYQGWKAYPVRIEAELGPAGSYLELALGVPYSSTCPCSAALARQLLAQRFVAEFSQRDHLLLEEVSRWLSSEAGSTATPHSQRSWARVETRISRLPTFPILPTIDSIEQELKTPVQTAVKREDEQAFAQLNGANLMFCEDAARRVKRALESCDWIQDYRLKVEHQESLHAHDAIALACKGVPGGYRV